MDFDSRPHPSPSYQLEESSGESDWDEDELPLSARHSLQEQAANKPLPPSAAVELRGGVEGLSKGGEVVWLTGEAGERVAQGVEVSSGATGSAQEVQVFVDGEQVGSIRPSSSSQTLVFLSTAIPLASLHPLVSALLAALEPSNSTILASYHLPSYIPPSENAPQSAAPVLYLASPSPSSTISQLETAGAVAPFNPPNLLHGLPSLLLMLSSLLHTCTSSTLLLLPTTTSPQPLNGPFSPLSPITHGTGATTIYDAGGPTGLGDPGALFREVASGPRAPMGEVKKLLGWDWWTPEAKGGKAFEWLEKQRRDRRREEVGSMYM
ncbi:hypothetical protein JCM6882_009562 [Rhodosporidiobolus microsporus]